MAEVDVLVVGGGPTGVAALIVMPDTYVAWVSITPPTHEAVVAEITAVDAAALGVSMSVTADISNPDDVRAAVAAVAAQLGPPMIVVHSAVHQFVRSIEDVSFAAWRRVQSVNVDALFHLVQATLPSMRAERWAGSWRSRRRRSSSARET